MRALLVNQSTDRPTPDRSPTAKSSSPDIRCLGRKRTSQLATPVNESKTYRRSSRRAPAISSHSRFKGAEDGGFPARLFFNPYAIMETPLGAFRAIHGTLAYGRVTSFPPIGPPVTICDCVPLEPIEDVRWMVKKGDHRLAKSIGRIVALSHPIDMEMQLPGEESFQFVSACIDHASDRAQSK